MHDRANSPVFKDFLKNGRDGEEWTASSKLFQTAVAAAEKLLPLMFARQVREIAKTVDDKKDRSLGIGLAVLKT